MRVMLDINIIMDVLLEREPFYENSKTILSLAERREISAYLSATAIPIIYYLIKRYVSKEKADEVTDIVISMFEIAKVDKDVIIKAKELEFKDFEDAIILSSAENEKLDFLITRNKRDFCKSKTVKVIDPEEFLEIWETKDG